MQLWLAIIKERLSIIKSALLAFSLTIKVKLDPSVVWWLPVAAQPSKTVVSPDAVTIGRRKNNRNNIGHLPMLKKKLRAL